MRGNAVRIIGIDPGLQHTGWGIIEQSGHQLRAIASGTISTTTTDDLAKRLDDIFRALCQIIETHAPTEAAIEESFMNNNAASAIKLGMARGVALLAPAHCGLIAAEYSARLIKKSLTGTGTADKTQISMMISRLMPGHKPDSSHAADALAIAICHGHHRQSQNYIQTHGGNDNMSHPRKAKP